MRELEAATKKEKEAGKLRELRTTREKDDQEEDSGEETEGANERDKGSGMGKSREVESGGFLGADKSEGDLRKRRSLGEQSSGELSPDSEWDKVGESEGDIAGKSSQE